MDCFRVLRQVIESSDYKPVKRPLLRRWRDAYGPDEVIQRIRPAESNAWLPNPHRGTTTYQRFQGDPLYAAWSWFDTYGPVEFSTVKTIADNPKYIHSHPIGF